MKDKIEIVIELIQARQAYQVVCLARPEDATTVLGRKAAEALLNRWLVGALNIAGAAWVEKKGDAVDIRKDGPNGAVITSFDIKPPPYRIEQSGASVCIYGPDRKGTEFELVTINYLEGTLNTTGSLYQLRTSKDGGGLVMFAWRILDVLCSVDCYSEEEIKSLVDQEISERGML